MNYTFKIIDVRYFIVMLISTVGVACNTSPTNKMQDNNKTAATDSLINNPGSIGHTEYVVGARLVAANDCLGCHKINVKATGPSYDSIALRYPLTEGNVELLAQKIITGGQGRWGQVPMTPHPTLEPRDAQEMVKYILSLRNGH
jgi:cytochrome c